jgi:hypothetical protein
MLPSVRASTPSCEDERGGLKEHAASLPGALGDNRSMADGNARMIFLGFGKYARADKIYALEPLRGDERGGGHRTRVWVDGVTDPIVASRTERTILSEMGQEAAANVEILDDAIALARRLLEGAEQGRLDLGDLQRRARRLLEATTTPDEAHQLF